jgi:hypothetical protein
LGLKSHSPQHLAPPRANPRGGLPFTTTLMQFRDTSPAKVPQTGRSLSLSLQGWMKVGIFWARLRQPATNRGQ